MCVCVVARSVYEQLVQSRLYRLKRAPARPGALMLSCRAVATEAAALMAAGQPAFFVKQCLAERLADGRCIGGCRWGMVPVCYDSDTSSGRYRVVAPRSQLPGAPLVTTWYEVSRPPPLALAEPAPPRRSIRQEGQLDIWDAEDPMRWRADIS